MRSQLRACHIQTESYITCMLNITHVQVVLPRTVIGCLKVQPIINTHHPVIVSNELQTSGKKDGHGKEGGHGKKDGHGKDLDPGNCGEQGSRKGKFPVKLSIARFSIEWPLISHSKTL